MQIPLLDMMLSLVDRKTGSAYPLSARLILETHSYTTGKHYFE